jgi:hypothetical protein
MIRNSDLQITLKNPLRFGAIFYYATFCKYPRLCVLVTASLAADFGSAVLIDEGLFSFLPRSDASGFPPGLPISPDGGDHLVCSGVEPIGFLASQMFPNLLKRCRAAQMNVGGLPTHGEEQPAFVTILGQEA